MKKMLLVVALLMAGGCAHPEPTRYQIYGIDKFRQIKTNAERHAGELYAFGGRVVDAERTRGQASFRLMVQNRLADVGEQVASDGPLIVVYPGGNTTVADGHQVKVLGYVREPAVGKNVFGVTVASFTLDAIAVYDAFTQYPFWLSAYEELFEKWKTGEPLGAKN
jgi:starvation-inducible outer membrane lipoprotein